MKFSSKIILFSILCLAALIVILNLPSKQLEKQTLRWGADSSSGAPFVFRNPAQPSEMIGVDVDVAHAIAEELGREAQFVQNTWEGLIPGLIADNYDVIINGFEILAERENFVRFSIPYYFTFEQIVVSSDDTTIHDLNDLNGKTVGTLPASLATRILKNMSEVNVKYYPEEVNAFADTVHNQRLDAVLIDAPIAKYYAGANPALKLLDTPVGNLMYGVGIRKENIKLQKEIDTALQHLIDSGKMREILEKWGLWNVQTAQAWKQTENSMTPPIAYLDYVEKTKQQVSFKSRITNYVNFIPLLARGALVTIEISLLSMMLAVTLGLLIAMMRLYGGKVLSSLAVLYIELIRGTPLLIQLYLIFYGLPLIGIKFSPFISALIGLGLNYAANEAENYRAGILSVPKHQMDAALALGMSRLQALRYVIFPQSIRLVIPPITNDFIALIKDSSIVSVITLVELTTVYNQLATMYADYLGIGLLVAFMYFFIGLPFSYLARYAEKRFIPLNRQKKLGKI